MKNIPVIDQLDIREKRVFIRVDFNVSMHDGQILDDTRIRDSLPTIEYALSQKAKIILASHLGRPKGQRNEKYTLLPVAEHLSDIMRREVILPEDCVGNAVKKLSHDLRDGQILLLENLRFHAEEEANDPLFAERLSGLGDIYIDDAFGCAHRAHASTVGMVKHFKVKGIGLLMKKELEFMGALIKNPQKPYLCILGGAKVSDKIGVIENMMNHVNAFIIGGGMAYTFLKAQGINVGKSLVEPEKIRQAEKILRKAKEKNIDFILPVDSIATPNLKEEPPRYEILRNGEDWKDWMGVDIGPESTTLFGQWIAKAKTIFWNGPMGVFEIPPFHTGTFEIARQISESKGVTVAGGGDSLAAIKQSGFEKRFTHLSTGGGASLEFLEGIELPGLKALETTTGQH